jgi:hypothetical protein
VRGDPPRVTERILHSAHPVAVELIGYRPLDLCARLDSKARAVVRFLGLGAWPPFAFGFLLARARRRTRAGGPFPFMRAPR